MSDERNPLKDTKEMLGDFLREVAALIFIFIPLEVALRAGITWRPLFYWTLGAFVTCALALWLGIRMERRRFDDATRGFRDALRVYFGGLRNRFAQHLKKDDE